MSDNNDKIYLTRDRKGEAVYKTEGQLPLVEVYADLGGKWRWRRVAVNGNITCNGAQDFTRPNDAAKAANENVGGLPYRLHIMSRDGDIRVSEVRGELFK